MFWIERTVVHVGAEKIVTLYLYLVSVKFEDFSFTFNDAEDYVRGEICRIRTHSVLFNFLQALRFKRNITLGLFFREALRHICVPAGA